MLPTAQGDVVPFPVESVAHMQGVVQEMLPVYKKACGMFEDNHMEFARTLRIFASSIEPHMLSYMWPLSLTHCAVRDEIPCLAWLNDHGEHICFLFSLVIHAGEARIGGVVPTHHHTSHVAREYNLQPPQALPLFEAFVSHCNLQSVLRAGIMYNECKVSVRPPGVAASGVPLASMMFPIINYSTCVTLQCERRIVEAAQVVPPPGTNVTVHVAYVTLAAVVLTLMPWELEDDERGEWFEQHEDVLAMLREDDGLTVFGVDSVLTATAQLTSAAVPQTHERRWGPRCRFLLLRRDGARLLNSLAELRWTLEAGEAELLDGLLDGHLICENCDFDKHDVMGNIFWPVRNDLSVLVCRENAANAAAHQRLRQELAKAERELEQTRNRMAVLEDDVERVDERARHAVVLAQRQDVLADVRQRLLPLSGRPASEELSLRGVENGLAGPTVVEMRYEPFEAGTGTAPVTGCLEAWESGEFLHQGHYRVQVPLPPTVPGVQEFHDMRMDFVAASRCMWVEGQALYLDVGRHEYAQLMILFPGLRVADKALHELLTADYDEGRSVQFKCHYVLSHGARATQLQHVEAIGDASYWDHNTPKDVLQMGVQLLLPVHVCNVHSPNSVYHDKEDNQYMLKARLYTRGEMRVHPHPRQHNNTVCEVFEYRHEHGHGGSDTAHSDIDIDPGESAVWWAPQKFGT